MPVKIGALVGEEASRQLRLEVSGTEIAPAVILNHGLKSSEGKVQIPHAGMNEDFQIQVDKFKSQVEKLVNNHFLGD